VIASTTGGDVAELAGLVVVVVLALGVAFAAIHMNRRR
jgi:hypothetical protein